MTWQTWIAKNPQERQVAFWIDTTNTPEHRWCCRLRVGSVSHEETGPTPDEAFATAVGTAVEKWV